MVRVVSSSHDQATAWRVRDALARHPLLGGATTEIQIDVCQDMVLLRGWVLDEGLQQLATRIAAREAGSRPVAQRLIVRQCNATQVRLSH